MALDVPFIFEVRVTGSDGNAGGFALGAQVAAPSAPTVTPSGTGGTVAAATYYCVVTYTDAWGETVISGETAVTTSGATASITVTSPAASTSAITWSVYFGTASGGPYFPQGTGLTIGSNRTVTTTPPTSGTQPKGVDYSVQDPAQINVADGVANGTTTVTSATAGFAGAHVGNLIKVGTAYRHIVGFTNSTTITVDATVTTGSTLAVVVGGAFATPGIVGGTATINGSVVYIKYHATAYGFSASTGVAGGGLANAINQNFIGYDTNRTFANTDANRPTIKPTANSATFWHDNGGQSSMIFHNLIFANPDAKTLSKVINGTGICDITLVKVSGFNQLLVSSTALSLRWCDISVATGQTFSSNTRLYGCDWHDGGAIQLGGNNTLDRCNVYSITSATGNAVVQCNSTGCRISNCNIYHHVIGSLAYAILLNANCQVDNCIIEDINGSSFGYVFGGVTAKITAFNCFYFNIKTALADPASVTGSMLSGMTLLSASPFQGPGAGNFATNTAAGGGLVVRGAGLPATYPAGTSANALDAGAIQHSDPAVIQPIVNRVVAIQNIGTY